MAARDIIQAAAGAAGATEANYIEDVFSTYLYTGNGGTQTINNGIDLATKGGLVWYKNRNASGIISHVLFDTARGRDSRLSSNLSDGQSTGWSDYFNFTNTGFEFPLGDNQVNTSGQNFASWTFRKQPKFFDVVTYTGDGTQYRQIAHSLGCAPGVIIVKPTSTTGAWRVWHKSLGDDFSDSYGLDLNTTDAKSGNGAFAAASSQTSTYFTTGGTAANRCNASGATYVAYLFADSNSGGFGSAGTDSVVACGSLTPNNNEIVLGWEPQYLLLKKTNDTGDWFVIDNMRGFDTSSWRYVLANTSAAEASSSTIFPTAKGFFWGASTSDTYIYLAIRRGPMKTPTDATKVFAPVTSSAATGTAITTGFPIDMQIQSYRSGAGSKGYVSDRLRGVSSTSTDGGSLLYTTGTQAEDTSSGPTRKWDNVGFSMSALLSSLSDVFWNFRRAPGFFDVVCYTGTGSATTVAHNLGVEPELIIFKKRTGSGLSFWFTYVKSLGNTTGLILNYDSSLPQVGTDSAFLNNTIPTTSVFTVGTHSTTNASGDTFVAYLFATCPGVSKVFSFTGNGSSQTIDCGFASGARFVLIKRTDAAGSWWVFDSARGIVSAADPALQLNSTAAEVTSADAIDPASSGFIVNQEATCNLNVSSGTYVFLAIA